MKRAKASRRRRSLREIFATPAIIGVLSALGLVGALVGDGLYDLTGWLGLGIPVAVMGWHLAAPNHHL